MTRPRILLDVDGVLADFVSHLLEGLIAWGDVPKSTTPEHITDYNIGTALGIDWKRINMVVDIPGFCETIPAYSYARELLAELETIGDVTVATAPYRGAPHWIGERLAWLDRLGLDGDRVCIWSQKHRVDGDILIEDSVKQAEAFAVGRRAAVLVARPWNTEFDRSKNICRCEPHEIAEMVAIAATLAQRSA